MKLIQQGTGDYLVLVHGALADRFMWLPHIKQLESDFEVISVSLRHFEGQDTGGFGLNTHAEDLTQLLQELPQHKPINLVAWSYGADVVLNALVNTPLPIAKIFLYEPGYPGCLQGETLESWQADANSMFGPVFEHVANGHLERAVEALIDASANKIGYFQSQSNTAKDLQLAKAHTLTHQLNQQENAAITPTTIREINAPIVLGFGLNTRELFRVVTVKTAQLAPNTEIKEIPGANHMLPQENPRMFSEYIKTIFSHSANATV